MVTLYRLGRRIEQCEEKVGIKVGGISRDIPYALHYPIVIFFRARPASASKTYVTWSPEDVLDYSA
jgi:hypothetical protein